MPSRVVHTRKSCILKHLNRCLHLPPPNRDGRVFWHANAFSVLNIGRAARTKPLRLQYGMASQKQERCQMVLTTSTLCPKNFRAEYVHHSSYTWECRHQALIRVSDSSVFPFFTDCFSVQKRKGPGHSYAGAVV